MAAEPPVDTSPEPGSGFDHRSDEELVAAANRGDAEAFSALYYRHRDWVARLALRLTGQPDLALDVLQETFLYLLRKFPGFTLTARLHTFLYPAVKNLSIAARRKADRFRSDPVELDGLPAPTSRPTTQREELAQALAMLSAEHREVLLLRFVDDLSLAEIAQALEVPLGTVKSRLHNALALLRQDERTRSYFAP